MIADAGLAIAAAGLTALIAWGPPHLSGTPITGPWWLRALLPLLLGAPLLLRRRAPLLVWAAIWAVLALALTLNRPLNPDFGPYPPTPEPFTFVLLAAAYSLGAYASPRRATAGLVVAIPVVVRDQPARRAGAAVRIAGRLGERVIGIAAACGVLPGRRCGPRPQAGRVDGCAERRA